MPYEGHRRVTEIVECGPFAEKLRVDGDAEAVPELLAGGSLQRRDDHIVGRSWQDGTAHDHHVMAVFLADCLADLLADALELRQVETAVATARRADANQREVSGRHGLDRIDRRAQRAGGGGAADDFVESLLDDRAAARVDAGRLVGIGIHANDRVALRRQCCCRHAPHVPESKH